MFPLVRRLTTRNLGTLVPEPLSPLIICTTRLTNIPNINEIPNHERELICSNSIYTRTFGTSARTHRTRTRIRSSDYRLDRDYELDTRYQWHPDEPKTWELDHKILFHDGVAKETGLKWAEANRTVERLVWVLQRDATKRQYTYRNSMLELRMLGSSKLSDEDRVWADEHQHLAPLKVTTRRLHGLHLYLIGKSLILAAFHRPSSPSVEGNFRIGQFALDVAVHYKNVEAALLVDRLDYEAQSDASFDLLADVNAAHNLIKDHIEATETKYLDWRVLVAHVEHIRFLEKWPSLAKLQDMLDLAQKADDLTSTELTAFDDSAQGKLPLLSWQIHTPPWRLLIEIIDEIYELYRHELSPKDQRRLQLVRRKVRTSAAIRYADPEMMWEVALATDPLSSTQVMSAAEIEQGLEPESKATPLVYLLLLTGAARGGISSAAWRLGKYHIERCRWWPVLEKENALTPEDTQEGRVGFEWLELAACLSGVDGENKPTTMHNRFAALASLLRLHGKKSESIRILNLSISELEKCVESATQQDDKGIETAKLSRVVKSAENLLIDHAQDHPETTNPTKLATDVQRILGSPYDAKLFEAALVAAEAENTNWSADESPTMFTRAKSILASLVPSNWIK